MGDTLTEGTAVSYDITVTPKGGTYYFGSKTVQLTLTVGKSQISYYDVARTYGDAESTQTPRWDKGAPSGLTYGISPQATGISIDLRRREGNRRLRCSSCGYRDLHGNGHEGGLGLHYAGH